MSAGKMVRHYQLYKVTIAQGAALSDELDMREFTSGVVYMPAAWTTADLGVQVAHTSGGTFQPLKDVSNGYSTTVSLDAVAASSCYPLPAGATGAHFLKLWSHNGSGVDTNQASAREIYVLLKS